MNNTKKPCMKTCLISFVGVFAFLFGYDWLVHGHLLMADYEATASMWRPKEEMQQFFAYCIAYHVILAAVITCWFKKVRACHAACATQCSTEGATTCCPIKSGGLCFGIKVGLLLGLAHASSYIWMPIPGDLAVKWFIAYLVQGAGAGCVLGMLCKSKHCGGDQGSCGSKAA